MLEITKQFIGQCSLTLGQFDSESVNLLVALFHHQSANSQLTHLSPTLKEKFQNLLTCKADDVDERSNDTPLTRIELATMIYFKQNYLAHAAANDAPERSRHHQRLSIEDELNLAYCFLLAAVDDRVSEHHLNEVKFFMKTRSPVTTLFDIYQDLGNSFSQFFAQLLQGRYLADRLVQVYQTILGFQLFIERYADFLLTFAEFYLPHSEKDDHSMQNDAILENRDAREIGKFMIELISSNREQMKSPIESAGLSPKARRTTLAAPTSPIKVPTSPIKTPTLPTPRPLIQRTVSSTTPASNVPRKALCVIINISNFTSNQAFDTPARAGSEKDVNLIKIIFNKLNFTILECKFDFKKVDLDRALDHIDDRSIYGHFDCLAIFIMSHGFVYSFGIGLPSISSCNILVFCIRSSRLIRKKWSFEISFDDFPTRHRRPFGQEKRVCFSFKLVDPCGRWMFNRALDKIFKGRICRRECWSPTRANRAKHRNEVPRLALSSFKYSVSCSFTMAISTCLSLSLSSTVDSLFLVWTFKLFSIGQRDLSSSVMNSLRSTEAILSPFNSLNTSSTTSVRSFVSATVVCATNVLHGPRRRKALYVFLWAFGENSTIWYLNPTATNEWMNVSYSNLANFNHILLISVQIFSINISIAFISLIMNLWKECSEETFSTRWLSYSCLLCCPTIEEKTTKTVSVYSRAGDETEKRINRTKRKERKRMSMSRFAFHSNELPSSRMMWGPFRVILVELKRRSSDRSMEHRERNEPVLFVAIYAIRRECVRSRCPGRMVWNRKNDDLPALAVGLSMEDRSVSDVSSRVCNRNVFHCNSFRRIDPCSLVSYRWRSYPVDRGKYCLDCRYKRDRYCTSRDQRTYSVDPCWYNRNVF